MSIGKKIEHSLKNTLAFLLKILLRQDECKPKPPYQRILFLRYDVIGDMILSIPVFKATRHAYPQTVIDVLCSQKNYILLADTGLADHLYVSGKNPLSLLKLIFEIRRKNYDLIINLVTRPSFTFGFLARLAGPHSVRIAGDQEQFSYFYNRIIKLPPKNSIHMMDRKFLVCADIISDQVSETEIPWVSYPQNIKKTASDLVQSCKDQLILKKEKVRIAAINLSAGLERREWPIDKNAAFLRHTIPQYQSVIDIWIILTNPAKPDEARQLAEMVDSPFIRVLPSQQDIRVIMEFLQLITVLITPDTSIAHAASAMGIPILVLTIGENVKIWDPIGVTNQMVLSDDLYSLKTLPVEDVIKGFNQLMNKLDLQSDRLQKERMV